MNAAIYKKDAVQVEKAQLSAADVAFYEHLALEKLKHLRRRERWRRILNVLLLPVRLLGYFKRTGLVRAVEPGKPGVAIPPALERSDRFDWIR